jgi:epoxyqueuosine reductase
VTLTRGELSAAVVDAARGLGFHAVGIAPALPARRFRAFEDWLERGMHGDMAYLADPEQKQARADVRLLLAGARSVVVVALAYDAGVVPLERLRSGSAAPAGSGSRSVGGARGGDEVPAGERESARGQVARYARNRDYHSIIKARLRELADRLSQLVGRPVASRPCVDTAPVLERELAERAGLGFVGKNTLLIAPGLGSYLLLGELILDVELEPSAAETAKSRCGACTACLEACPTGAFVGPHVLDARRCISYLTIEHRGAIPRELRSAVGTRIFGCDVCQEVCPFNAAAPARTAPDPGLALTIRAAERSALDLVRTLGLGTAQMRQLVRGTPLRRAGRDGLLRNVCVALGNTGDPAAIPALARALAGDRSPLVRGHAAWALGRLGAREVLAAAHDRDEFVSGEIAAALAELVTPP